MPLHTFIILLVTLSICGALVILALVIVYVIYRRSNRIQSENTIGEEESDIKSDSRSENMSDCNSVRDAVFDREKLSRDVSSELKTIDKSTSFFGLHIVTEECLMENFARKYYKGYQPTKGFGYYELANPDDKLDPSWNVILTDEVCFTCTLQGLLIHVCTFQAEKRAHFFSFWLCSC